MKWLRISKRDLFFGVLASSLLIVSLSYAFGQYIRLKAHNLDVTREIRICTGSRCDERATQNYIFLAPAE